MQVWNMLRDARWKCRIQKIRKKSPSGTIAQLCRAISLQLRYVSSRQLEKNFLKQQYLSHMFSHYGELRFNSGWDPFGCLGYSCKFQRILRLHSITARHSNSGRQSNFAVVNRGRYLYSVGWRLRWVLVHILFMFILCCLCCLVKIFGVLLYLVYFSLSVW